MASPIRVKEEAVDIFHVATDSDGDTEGEDISLEDLQQLDTKFATNPNFTKFPVGCKIWYNARNSRAPTKLLRAKSASVVGVYMHFEKIMQRVYKVRSDAPSQYDVFLYEDRLVYGMNCPVTVANAYTNDTRDGVIVCPKLDAGNDGKQQIAYDVQITQGSNVTIEFGAAAERIKYRMEKSSVKNTTGEKEEGSGVKGLEAKESKVDCDERKELHKSNSVSTNSNDVEVSVLKPGVEQLEMSAFPPAPSAKAASGAKVAKACNVAADEYSKLADNRQTTTRENDQYEDTESGVKVESVEDNRKECGERNDQKLDIARWEPPSPSLQRKRSSGSDANDRPVKVSRVKTDRDESIDFLTCTLNIPGNGNSNYSDGKRNNNNNNNNNNGQRKRQKPNHHGNNNHNNNNNNNSQGYGAKECPFHGHHKWGDCRLNIRNKKTFDKGQADNFYRRNSGNPEMRAKGNWWFNGYEKNNNISNGGQQQQQYFGGQPYQQNNYQQNHHQQNQQQPNGSYFQAPGGAPPNFVGGQSKRNERAPSVL